MRHTLPMIAFAAMLAAPPVLANDEVRLNEARRVAASVPPKLLAVLSAEINKNGHAAAIAVCQDQAPRMAKAASEQTGWAIRRVSLRNRNPRAVPDAWEDAALKDFDRRAAAGESAAALERWDVLSSASGKEYRYIKALPVQPLCLACHGPTEQITPDVAAQLKTRYPNDLGTGYTVGQLRGAITLRKPQ